MFNHKFRVAAMLISFIFILSCGEKIPVKEMTQAKLEISRALSVSAKKYAPQEINDAEKKLLESHDFIKQDSLDKSKNSAIEAGKKAVEAYNKAIPLLAKDTLDAAKQNLEGAEGVYAEVLAEAEYKEAKSLYAKAGELFEQKDYYPCYEKSLEADARAREAKSTAIGKKEILSKSITEVRSTLAEAEKYNASLHAKDKVQAANENIIVAEQSLAGMELKKGFAAVEIAGTNADEAYLTALKETSRGKMEGAEKLYSEAEKSEGAVIAKDELRGAKEVLDQSKSFFQNSKYKDSMVSSDESTRLSNIVLGAMKDSAREKIAGAEMIFKQARESSGAALAKAELKGANDALDSSKSHYLQSRYKDAVAAAAECERLSNIVINTKEQAQAQQARKASTLTPVSEDDFFMYKVRYIPERRDCLWRIAEKYYSNPFFWQNIYKANTDKIRNPNLIWPDMMLKVPKLKKTGKPGDERKASPETNKEAVPVSAKGAEEINKAESGTGASQAAENKTGETPASGAAKESVIVPETKNETVPPPDEEEAESNEQDDDSDAN